MWIGKDTDSNEDVYIDPSALKRMTGVVGTTGSGKTVLAKAVIEEAITNGTPVLAIDPQGDIARLAMKGSDKELLKHEVSLEKRDAYFDNVSPAIFTPGTNHGINLIIDPVVSYPDPNNKTLASSPDEVNLILQSIANNTVGLFRTLSKKQVVHSSHFLFKTLETAFEEKRRLTSLDDLRTSVEEFAPSLALSAQIRKVEPALLSNLELLLEGDMAHMFKGGIPLNLDLFLKPKKKKVPLNVFLLSGIRSAILKEYFVAVLATELYSYMIRVGRAECIFFIDEVSLFIPAGTKQTLCKQSLLDLLGQGRKYGVSMIIATQSPGKMDYYAFGQCNTRAYGKLVVKQDLEKIKEFIPPEVLSKLPTLKTGRFFVDSLGEHYNLQVRWLYSDHGAPVRLKDVKSLMDPSIVKFYATQVPRKVPKPSKPLKKKRDRARTPPKQVSADRFEKLQDKELARTLRELQEVVLSFTEEEKDIFTLLLEFGVINETRPPRNLKVYSVPYRKARTKLLQMRMIAYRKNIITSEIPRYLRGTSTKLSKYSDKQLFEYIKKYILIFP
ncbi:MAG: ATP-binding protein [Promethearchaeota archaeon]